MKFVIIRATRDTSEELIRQRATRKILPGLPTEFSLDVDGEVFNIKISATG